MAEGSGNSNGPRKRGPATPEGKAKALENLVPFKPGQVGNPAGRKTAGAVIREYWNSFAEAELTEADVRRISEDKSQPVVKRTAAARFLLMIENYDIADFQAVLRGEITLEQARETGLNTGVIKRFKRNKMGEIELELHDRAGSDIDRIMDRTEGKPKQTVDVNQHNTITPADGANELDQIAARLGELLRPGPN